MQHKFVNVMNDDMIYPIVIDHKNFSGPAFIDNIIKETMFKVLNL